MKPKGKEGNYAIKNHKKIGGVPITKPVAIHVQLGQIRKAPDVQKKKLGKNPVNPCTFSIKLIKFLWNEKENQKDVIENRCDRMGDQVQLGNYSVTNRKLGRTWGNPVKLGKIPSNLKKNSVKSARAVLYLETESHKTR